MFIFAYANNSSSNPLQVAYSNIWLFISEHNKVLKMSRWQLHIIWIENFLSINCDHFSFFFIGKTNGENLNEKLIWPYSKTCWHFSHKYRLCGSSFAKISDWKFPKIACDLNVTFFNKSRVHPEISNKRRLYCIQNSGRTWSFRKNTEFNDISFFIQRISKAEVKASLMTSEASSVRVD